MRAHKRRASRIARPLRSLADAARQVGEGPLERVAPLPASAIAELDVASHAFNRMVDGLRERDLIRDTLGRFVSEEVARGLLAGKGTLEPVHTEATALLCDIEGFAALTDARGPGGTVAFLNAYFEAMAGCVERRGGVITQFQGDAVLAVFNIPLRDEDHAANALRGSIDMIAAADSQAFAGVRVRNRAGVCTGRIVAGAVGSRGRQTYTIHGSAVNLAARLEALNKDYGTRILVSARSAALCPRFALRRVADATIRDYAEPIALFTPVPESRDA